MKRFHALWAVWVFVGLILETIGLIRDKNKTGYGTFCEFYRYYTGIRPVRKARWFSVTALAAALVWFFVHISFPSPLKVKT